MAGVRVRRRVEQELRLETIRCLQFRLVLVRRALTPTGGLKRDSAQDYLLALHQSIAWGTLVLGPDVTPGVVVEVSRVHTPSRLQLPTVVRLVHMSLVSGRRKDAMRRRAVMPQL